MQFSGEKRKKLALLKYAIYCLVGRSSDISVTTGTGKREPVRLHLKMLIVADDEKCRNFGPGSVYCRKTH